MHALWIHIHQCIYLPGHGRAPPVPRCVWSCVAIAKLATDRDALCGVRRATGGSLCRSPAPIGWEILHFTHSTCACVCFNHHLLLLLQLRSTLLPTLWSKISTLWCLALMQLMNKVREMRRKKREQKEREIIYICEEELLNISLPRWPNHICVVVFTIMWCHERVCISCWLESVATMNYGNLASQHCPTMIIYFVLSG